MNALKVKFVDFWEGFSLIPDENAFLKLLYQSVPLEFSDEPDVLFYSAFGKEHNSFNGPIKIFYTGENVGANFAECDFALTFDFSNSVRHLRLPLYFFWFDVTELTRPKDPREILKKNVRFCNFVYSNPNCEKRNRFFKKLSQYKPVDSAGQWLNNGFVLPRNNLGDDKCRFINDYKFTLAFENNCLPGYTTEKLTEPMRMNSLPIYWGNKLVHLDFNPKSFINLYDFKTEDDAIEWIIKVDQDDELYMSYFREPYFHSNQLNEYCQKTRLAEFLINAVSSSHLERHLLTREMLNLRYLIAETMRRASNRLGQNSILNRW